ncbi:MAG: copper resistance protein CopC [Betaproteobacteria bacterium]
MKKWLLTLWAATLVSAFAPFAGAHAHLDRALPAAGSVVRESPRELKLWFTQRLESAFSEVRVIDAAGRRADKGDAKVDVDDAKVLRVSLPKLAPGSYRVKWRVLSVDTHVSEGEFTIDVAP